MRASRGGRNRIPANRVSCLCLWISAEGAGGASAQCRRRVDFHGRVLRPWVRDSGKALPMKNRLRVLRAEKNWTQAELAEIVGVSRQAVIAVENGKYDPALPLAFKLARAFGKNVEEVFVWEDGSLHEG